MENNIKDMCDFINTYIEESGGKKDVTFINKVRNNNLDDNDIFKNFPGQKRGNEVLKDKSGKDAMTVAKLARLQQKRLVTDKTNPDYKDLLAKLKNDEPDNYRKILKKLKETNTRGIDYKSYKKDPIKEQHRLMKDGYKIVSNSIDNYNKESVDVILNIFEAYENGYINESEKDALLDIIDY